MTTCLECSQLNPKGTDKNMLRTGFVQCLQKRLPGHYVSPYANACGRFSAADAKTVTARREWSEKQSKA